MALKSRKVFSAVHIFIITLLLVSSTLAQTPRERLGIRQTAAQEPQQTEEEKKAAKEIEKKALVLINELVAEAMSLRLAENRVYVLTVMSDVLWARDEERARALVRKAMDQVVAHMREMKEKATEEDWERFDSRYLHYMVSDLLARRDAKLALEFLQQTRPLRPKERQQKNLELSLASQIAESDPQTALRIAEEYLNGKLDYMVIHFWSELLRNAPKAASPLTKKIIANLKSQDILADYNSSDVAFSVLGVLRSRVNEIADARNNPNTTNAARLDSTEIQQAYRDALEIVVAAALKVTAAQLHDHREGERARNLLTRNLLTQAQTLLPDIEKHLPSRAPAVRAKLAQFDEALNSLPAPQSPSLEDLENTLKDLENTMENKSPDELIAMAAASLNLDLDRGFEILGSALDRLNTLLIALTTMNKFDQRGAPSLFASNAGNSEMFFGDFATINLATDLNERLLAFARKDINRTVALLKRLQVNEVRLMICLRLLNGVLGGGRGR